MIKTVNMLGLFLTLLGTVIVAWKLLKASGDDELKIEQSTQYYGLLLIALGTFIQIISIYFQ